MQVVIIQPTMTRPRKPYKNEVQVKNLAMTLVRKLAMLKSLTALIALPQRGRLH